MRSSIIAWFVVALAAASASPNKPTITPSAVTSTSLATVTEVVNLTSTITVSSSASSTPNATASSSTSLSANATSPATTSGALTDLLSATACNTAGVSVITSVVTQVSTKTVDHFITVTVGAGSSGNKPGSKGQNGNLGAPPSKPTVTSAVQQPKPVVTTMATVKPVTTVVVEQTKTVFVTSFVTTTVEVKGGATRTHTTMATSTVTSVGMATHTRTRTSTMMITLTKTDTSVATSSASSTSKGGIKDIKTTSATSSSSPCPTDPVTLTVTRSSQTTSKVGIKDSNTSSSRFTTRTRGTTSLQTATSSRSSNSVSSTGTVSQTRATGIATTSARTRTTASGSVSSTGTVSQSGATSITTPVRTRTTASSSISSTGTLSQSDATSITTTSARATTTASRFSTSIVRSSGTFIRASTKASSAAGATATGAAGAGDPQTSLDLDPKVIMSNLAKDGQDTPTEGQVPSLTTRNNFINFCATQNVPLTNGEQVKAGSCNGVPMGRILAVDKIPTSKFVFPKNGQTIPANKAFTIRMAIKNLKTGNFVNPTTNYYSAPAQTTEDGTLIGHSHCVIEALTSKDQVDPSDPRKFAFFKGLNLPDVNGVLTAEVTAGLPAGEYRIASINAAANHQPALPAVAQRGSVDDISYFTVA